MSPEVIILAEQTLSKKDPVMQELIGRHGSINYKPHRDYFTALARAIIGQQLSVKAAASIFRRFESTTDLNPEKIITLREDDIKAIGLSRPKARYIQDLAQHFAKDPVVFNHLENLTDDQVIKELTAIKGVGAWTAQMFLMFTLVRPDVFAPDDVGLQNAVTRAYGLKSPPLRNDLIAFAERWRPYRTVASWHLWQSLDNQPTKNSL